LADQKRATETEFDVIVVGAGLAGLYMLHRLRGLGLSARVLERGSGVGGTWFWNRYPGARCDIESVEYSYQFSEELQAEWDWTERYASQAEILAYINHVADRFDLRRDIQLDTSVESAAFDESTNHWSIRTDDGGEFRAPFCVMATGCLSCRITPDLEALESYKGEIYYTSDWPHEGVDLVGKRIGVIGTGSSGTQSIPLFAEEAEHLHVFQRTPNYSVPSGNAPMDPEFLRSIKADYAGFRKRNNESPWGTAADLDNGGPSAVGVSLEEREQTFERMWEYGGTPFLITFDDLMVNQESNDAAGEFVKRKIREKVDDPAIAEILLPKQNFGCKRLCTDMGYFETFNRTDVTLVDVSRDSIVAATAKGLRLASGDEFDLDVIVFATGFDAMTGALLAIDPRGRSGQPLSEKWAEGAKTFLGLGVSGFPNLFTVTGPGSPSVLSNMVPAIEQHVNWIADCITYLRENGHSTIEATPSAEGAWVAHVNEVANTTLFPACNSWYVGANIEGKPRVFLPYIGFGPYVEKCDEVASKSYEGFVLSS
jgi:cation diffusion facilitator CzcD-associated flavoprotein CzcO